MDSISAVVPSPAIPEPNNSNFKDLETINSNSIESSSPAAPTIKDASLMNDDIPGSTPMNIKLQKSEPQSHESLEEDEVKLEQTNGNDEDVMSGKQGGHEVKKSQQRKWDTSTPLFCPNNGRNHGVLLDFDFDYCPLCDKILQPTVAHDLIEKTSSEHDEPEVSSPSIELNKDTDTAREDLPSKEDETKITYAVWFEDSGGNLITKKDWSSPFDLREARQGILGKTAEKKGLSFQILTVLRTSIPSNRHLLERQKILDDGILENPNVNVFVYSTKLIIKSQPFVDTLKAVMSYDSSINLDFGSIEVPEPFSIIGHHMDELKAYKDRLLNKINENHEDETGKSHRIFKEETIKHLSLALDFMKDIYKDQIRDELERHAQKTALCTFRMLWLLFKPGRTIYVKEDDVWNAYVVDSVYSGDTVLTSPPEYLSACHINMWYLDFEGQYVSRRRKSTSVQPFQGEIPIMTLRVIPSDVFDVEDGGKLKNKLELEGEKWYSLLSGDQVHYVGPLIDHRSRLLEGRVYADTASFCDTIRRPLFEPFLEKTPIIGPENGDYGGTSETCSHDEYNSYGETRQKPHDNGLFKPTETKSRWAGYLSIDPEKTKDLTLDIPGVSSRHRYLLCSRYLKGFVFKTRKWETLDVAFCNKPKLNKTPLKNLVMSEDRKTMIKALVYKYTDPRFKSANKNSQVWGADFIENKGEGQIFLLHGGPGVGKTFTAECIAEFTGRPLLSLTCGDIGTDEDEIERNLSKWLNLAHKWGAVMLLDEADVFLEKRQEGDIKRNSLVSVFLREIEYYRGILFLTTNRVGQFDDAFISRIHVVLHYPDLSEKDRQKIWRQFFTKLEEEKGDSIKIMRSARTYVLDDCKAKWNGREIRNAFQTAVALAEYRFLSESENEKDSETAELRGTDLEDVCNMTLEFKDYLTEVHGGNEQERAQLARSRIITSATQQQDKL